MMRASNFFIQFLVFFLAFSSTITLVLSRTYISGISEYIPFSLHLVIASYILYVWFKQYRMESEELEQRAL